MESSLARCYHNLCPELWILSPRFVSNARLYVFRANNIPTFGTSYEVLLPQKLSGGGWQIVSGLFVSASELWFLFPWSLQITAAGSGRSTFSYLITFFGSLEFLFTFIFCVIIILAMNILKRYTYCTLVLHLFYKLLLPWNVDVYDYFCFNCIFVLDSICDILLNNAVNFALNKLLDT